MAISRINFGKNKKQTFELALPMERRDGKTELTLGASFRASQITGEPVRVDAKPEEVIHALRKALNDLEMLLCP